MKKSSLVLAALTLSTIFGSSLISSQAASPCDAPTKPNDPRTAADPFGSCERQDGSVRCGSGTAVGPLATVIVDANKGVQGCAADENALPIAGRVSVYKDSSNNVAVAADGGDKKNQLGASGWNRTDVRPGEGRVCFRRGASGTWYTGANSGRGTSNPTEQNLSTGALCQ